VSQYVANLNTIPSAQDTASRNQVPLEIENDLALFTNTEFFDFDLGEVPDLTEPVDYDPAMEERARRQNASAYNRHLNSNNTNTNNNSSKSVDFMNGMFTCFLVGITSFIFRTSAFHCHCPYCSDLGITCGSAFMCGLPPVWHLLHHRIPRALQSFVHGFPDTVLDTYLRHAVGRVALWRRCSQGCESPKHVIARDHRQQQLPASFHRDIATFSHVPSITMTNAAVFPGDFKFPDLSSFPNTVADPSMSNLQPTQINGYHIPTYSPPASTSPISPQFDKLVGEKRKLDAITDPNSVKAIEDTSRIAAEEDKRRRNTAASARFRVKKKQREQALEKTAKEMTEKVSVLESKVTQLEMENKWLKSLITEKNESSADITAMYKKFTKENLEARSTGERTDGVGTSAGHNEKAKA